MISKYHVYDIEYDVSEDDLDYDVVDVERAIRELEAGLPDELHIEIEVDESTDIEDYITNEISNITGWLVYNYKYERET